MTRQTIEVHGVLAAPIREVWSLLEDVTTWSDWAGFDEAAYDEEGTPDRHGTGAVRRFRAGPLRSRERVLAHDPPSHLAYDYEGSLPIRDYRADVTLVETVEGTAVTWRAEFTRAIPLTGAVLRLMLTGVLRRTVARLDRATR